jgi:hypothetical protein
MLSPNAALDHFRKYHKSIPLNTKKVLETKMNLDLVNPAKVEVPVKGLKVHKESSVATQVVKS